MRVVAQKDICPHGRTYPKKVVIIVSTRRVKPDVQVMCRVKELKYSPRAMCSYRQINNKLFPFYCNEQMSQASKTS